jgi:hypothetical protein
MHARPSAAHDANPRRSRPRRRGPRSTTHARPYRPLGSTTAPSGHLPILDHAQPPDSAGALRHGHRLCRARSSWIDALADRSTPSDRRRVAQHLAELRQVNGLDVTTLAARANLDPEVVAEIEAGTRTWTLDDWARRWLAVRVHECERGEVPASPSPCTERLRQQFEATVEVLRHAPEREGLDDAAVIDERRHVRRVCCRILGAGLWLRCASCHPKPKAGRRGADRPIGDHPVGGQSRRSTESSPKSAESRCRTARDAQVGS